MVKYTLFFSNGKHLQMSAKNKADLNKKIKFRQKNISFGSKSPFYPKYNKVVFILKEEKRKGV